MRSILRIICIVVLALAVSMALDQFFKLGEGGTIPRLLLCLGAIFLAITALIFIHNARTFPERQRLEREETDFSRRLGIPLD